MLFCGFFPDYSTSIRLSCNESSLDFLKVMLEETDSTCAIPYIYIYVNRGDGHSRAAGERFNIHFQV